VTWVYLSGAGGVFLIVSIAVHLTFFPVALFRWRMEPEEAHAMAWLCTAWPVLLYRLPRLVREQEKARKIRMIRKVMES